MIIELRNINKTYNNGTPLHVLKGIDLDMETIAAQVMQEDEPQEVEVEVDNPFAD